MEKADHYRILGVSRKATPEEVKSAYRREALRWHPDRNFGDREAEERFKAASAAYEVLRDPEKRRAYDMELTGFVGRAAAFAGHAPGQRWGRRCGGGRRRRCARGFGPVQRRRARAGFGTPDALLVDVDLDPIEAILGCRRGIIVESVCGARLLDIRLPPGLADGDVVEAEDLGVHVCFRVSIASAV